MYVIMYITPINRRMTQRVFEAQEGADDFEIVSGA
jgi:hypothetical protein